MKIVHIANFYGPKSGGIKTTLHQLGTGYVARGHSFTYIGPGTGFYCEESTSGTRITLPSIEIPFSGGYRIIRNNRDVKKLLITLKPDVLEISDRFTLSKIGAWAGQRNIAAVVFSHETLSGLAKNYFPFSLKRIVDWHNRRLSSRFKHVITTTEFASKEFEEIKTTNLVRVPLGVDLDKFSPYLRNEDFRKDLLQGADVLLVHCGRMSREKHPARSIEALKVLLERGINARLIYVGIGPMYVDLREKSKGLPVTFLGYIADRERLAEILATADVSLAPGPIETFCLAALESLAAGTPVVASNTSAVGEFLLINTSEPVGAIAGNSGHEFANAIERVLEMRKDPKLPQRCFHQAENFPWSATLSLMLKLHGDSAESKRRLRAA